MRFCVWLLPAGTFVRSVPVVVCVMFLSAAEWMSGFGRAVLRFPAQRLMAIWVLSLFGCCERCRRALTWTHSCADCVSCVFAVCANTGRGFKQYFFPCPGLAGGNIILACRDMEKCEAAAKDIRGETLNHRVRARHLDLASLKSVREFAAKITEGRREDAGLGGEVLGGHKS